MINDTTAVRSLNLAKEADRILLNKYVPPGVMINADLDIQQFRGDTGPYLAPAPGKASFNILKMAREGLLVPLRAAMLLPDKRLLPLLNEHGKLNPEIAQLVEQRREQRRGRER